ncbi:hypothetical protein BMETH_723_1 [methanotrophic bacterial endosymbiont of Bathymodiolus sp.]|nr:hypothetical protein BMETH_723_1 [methanotrophic bacterial endosymbiont of Bathymodiolus sp.]
MYDRGAVAAEEGSYEQNRQYIQNGNNVENVHNPKMK